MTRFLKTMLGDGRAYCGPAESAHGDRDDGTPFI